MTRQARAHLTTADPVLGRLIVRVGHCGLAKVRDGGSREPYEALVRAIAYQQLHGRAAETILGRFLALYPGESFPAPAHILGTDPASLRACGFSASKAAAIVEIAAKAAAGVVPSRRAALRLPDGELIERLTTIRGVGRWTVEMLLMFSLGRPDILPVDDFGVREGYRLLHEMPRQPKPRELAAIGEAWAPFRSYATWYLWRAVEATRAAKLVPPT